MARIFKGMSVDNFLDGLVNATGLNGHELYNYLIDKIGNEKERSNETALCFSTYANDTKCFEGNRDEFYDYLRFMSGNMNEKFGAVSSFGLCVYAAKLNKVRHFVWKRPAQCRTTDGQCHYTIMTEEVFLDDRGEPTV